MLYAFVTMNSFFKLYFASCSDLHKGHHGEYGRENSKMKNISENTRGEAPIALALDPSSQAPGSDACLRLCCN